MFQLGTKLLHTDRLILRQFKEEDVQQVYENYGNDSKVNKYISFAPCATLEGANKFVMMHLTQYKNNLHFYGWAITLNDNVIGSIGLFNIDEDGQQCEIGYSIGSKWWGLGYATEAANAVLSFAFNELKAHRVYASHHIDNIASRNVLLKIGMIEEGTLRDGQCNVDGSFSDLKLYSKLITD